MKRYRSGFILPTILIVGTVLLFVLAFVLETIATGRGAMRSSHFQLLARQAAESGIARAKACLMENDRLVTWSDTNPLRNNTDCFGNELPSDEASLYFLSDKQFAGSKMRSYFEVRPSDVHDDYKNVAAIGRLEILEPDGNSVKKTYEHRMSAYISTGVTFDDIAFGSIFTYGINQLDPSAGSGLQTGVYFFTKTATLGVVKGVGSNSDDVLRGWEGGPEPPSYYYATPYALDLRDLPSINNLYINKVFTDFQGNGWNAYLLTKDNRVFATGVNDNAMMGTKQNNGLVPTTVKWPHNSLMANSVEMVIPDGEEVDRIFTNGGATYVLMKSRNLYVTGRTWGLGLMGCGNNCLGKDHVNELVRVQFEVGGTLTNEKKIVKFNSDILYNVERTSTYAITEEGEVYGWGSNECGQLGRSYPSIGYPWGCGSASNQNGKYIGYGVRVGNFGTAGHPKAVDVQTDGQSVWILDNNGTVWSAGRNQFKQLARANNEGGTSSFRSDVAVAKLAGQGASKRVIKIAADAYSVMFLNDKGDVITAGLNDVGQLGNNTTNQHDSGKKYNIADAEKKIVDIFITSPGVYKSYKTGSSDDWMYEARKYRNTYVITTDGSVYGAGSNYFGQLGTNCHQVGNESNYINTSGVRMGVVGRDNIRVRSVRSGLGTTIGITDKNIVYTVGNNHNGQLGDGTTITNCTPAAHQYTNMYKTWYF